MAVTTLGALHMLIEELHGIPQLFGTTMKEVKPLCDNIECLIVMQGRRGFVQRPHKDV